MRSYSVDKPIIIKAHAVKYFTNIASHQPFQNRTIPPAFRNANIYMHDTLSNSHTKLASLVKGEVLSPDKIRATTGGIATPPSSPRTNPSKTALSLENRQHSCLLMNALPVSQNVANRQHPCLPSKKGRWHG